MNTTQNSENSFESLYDECLGARKTPTTHVVSEEAFDGDFDSLAGEIKSLENLVDFASAYEDLQAYHTDQKIRMLKKLKVATRGTTSYHASVESYLDHELSLEADAAPNTEAGSKVDNPNTGKAGKAKEFFAKMWEKIKTIFAKICDFIKQIVQKVVGFIRSKLTGDSGINNEIQQCQQQDPESFKDMVNALGNLSFEEVEMKSEYGLIPLTNGSVEKFKNSVDAYKVVCTKFQAITKEIASSKTFTSSILDHCKNLTSVIGQVFGIQINASIGGTDKDSINKFNAGLKQELNNLDYQKDPARFVAKLCGGAKLISPKNKFISPLCGSSSPMDVIKTCNAAVEALNGVAEAITEHKKIVEKSMNDFSSFLRSQNISNGNGLNAGYANGKKPEQAEGVALTMESAVVIMTLSRYLVKVEGIFQRITKEITISAETGVKALFKVKADLIKRSEKGFWSRQNKDARKEYGNLRKNVDPSLRKGISAKEGKVQSGLTTAAQNIKKAATTPFTAGKKAAGAIKQAGKDFAKGFKD